jgi:CDP-glucose 4,6-dehydratase
VLVTGHTGFKGGWLSVWLASRQADVAGLALAPDSDPSFFAAAGVADLIRSHLVDLRDRAAVRALVESIRPEVVFHLAAQPLVRRGYREPIETFATNVMGTAHLLDALRDARSLRAVVVVTSDKCYENTGAGRPFREDDPLGGHDPYSASKAACEVVAAAFRRAFGLPLATARAGNVIGGGDWAEDRLVADAMRAFPRGQPLGLRNPGHVRPWQHVLDPLAGYLALAEALLERPEDGAGAWNFGPDATPASTADVARLLARAWGEGASFTAAPDAGPPESPTLSLDAGRARQRLGWRPRLPLEDAVGWTVEWHRAVAADPGAAREITLAQIRRYEALP